MEGLLSTGLPRLIFSKPTFCRFQITIDGTEKGLSTVYSVYCERYTVYNVKCKV